MAIERLGFFTRLLDDTSPSERYRIATEQIVHAERHGFDSAWIAQHHFNENEGGLPAPLVLLAHAAALTRRIRLGTGIIILPLESPIRTAEDTAVLDLISGGRLEVGFGTGGVPASFAAFGLDSGDRQALLERHMAVVLEAWAGRPLPGGERLYPPAPDLHRRIWQATFSVAGGTRIGKAGHGLMLSRTQPRPADRPDASLADLQLPIIEAYLAALPRGVEPRILASRSVLVVDDRAEGLRLAAHGLNRVVDYFAGKGHVFASRALDDVIRGMDVHVGTADDVITSLAADETLKQSTDFVSQVHSIDPPEAVVLRSIELIAGQVAPALGWQGGTAKPSALQPVEPLVKEAQG